MGRHRLLTGATVRMTRRRSSSENAIDFEVPPQRRIATILGMERIVPAARQIAARD
jgi:hypothetical protein